MASPLLPYANAFLLITASGNPQVVNGRFTAAAGKKYLVRCYLTRQDSTGTTTGADYLPGQSAPGDVLPGVSGDVYLYRGYGLGYIEVANDFNLAVGPMPTTGWLDLRSDAVPAWLVMGVSGQHRQGNEKVKYMKVERCTGKFGGGAIDFQVSVYIGGIPLIIRSGDVID